MKNGVVSKETKTCFGLGSSSTDSLSIYDKYLATIGNRLPTPKAFVLTLMIGQNWARLYSFMFTNFKILFTKAAS